MLPSPGETFPALRDHPVAPCAFETQRHCKREEVPIPPCTHKGGEASASCFGGHVYWLFSSSLHGCPEMCLSEGAVKANLASPLPSGWSGFAKVTLASAYPPSGLVFLYCPGSSWKGCPEWVITSGLEIAFFSCPRYDTVTSPIEPSLQEEQRVLVMKPREVTWPDSGGPPETLFPLVGQELSTEACLWQTLASHPQLALFSGFSPEQFVQGIHVNEWMSRRVMARISGEHLWWPRVCTWFCTRRIKESPWPLTLAPSSTPQRGHKEQTGSPSCWFGEFLA